MVLSWLIARITRELAARRSIRLLASLSDHELGRMGLSRGQIGHAVRDWRS
jgi:uncharacterized protein YjiS (DUF1127 family)